LPLCHGLSLKETAQALGITPGWASQLRNRFIAGVRMSDTPRRGGRHHAFLTPQEETELLPPFIEEAARGGILVVSQIKTRLESQPGRLLALSTVYALPHRHGWRKPAPDKRHPPSDPQAQEAWKKSSRTHSRNCGKNSPRAPPSA
jgi:transposase